MKSIKILMLLICMSLLYSGSNAQTTELLGGNLLNGAITGSMLGVATMGLNDSGDFAPVRIGLGAGILGGAGVAVYDYATLPKGDHFFVSGVFNDGNNSSIIILLDTVYGTAGGALIGTASMLVADRKIVGGLQYGASAGAWAGFAFGLVDALLLSDRNRDFISSDLLKRESFFSISSERYRIGMIQPAAYFNSEIIGNEIKTTIEPAVGVISFSIVL